MFVTAYTQRWMRFNHFGFNLHLGKGINHPDKYRRVLGAIKPPKGAGASLSKEPANCNTS
ncbi:unnamed protein product [Staurois parvus]|uniref:Uncharacterized protein n=1 Tax=Staurois parvus TaxID=386267 RepID=A0ABN9EF06_9NEOB|nr:unnamed protein product [Staurois parvus]